MEADGSYATISAECDACGIRTRLAAAFTGWATLFVVAVPLTFTAACAARPAAVSPGEIPALKQRLAQDSTDATAALRLSAALFAAGQCAEAERHARLGQSLKPEDALGTLVAGQCLEQASRYADAVAEYERYLDRWPNAHGAAAVRARERLAMRALATEEARQAIASEMRLAAVGGDAETVAVLPTIVSGDEEYAPLSIGLAALITSDLAILGRFQLVERLQMHALLAELQIAGQGLADPATAARVGRLTRAGRMIQASADVRPTSGARLAASVVAATGDVTATGDEAGRLQDLLRLEKDLVIGIAEELGPPLTTVERSRILENGTRNLLAFLAFSRGLEAELRGDYQAAAAHFATALQADPGFAQARQEQVIAAAGEIVANATPDQVTTVAVDADNAVADAQSAIDGAGPGSVVANAVADIASTQGERATTAAGDPTVNQPINQLTSTPSSGVVPPPPTSFPALIRIVIPIPR